MLAVVCFIYVFCSNKTQASKLYLEYYIIESLYIIKYVLIGTE